MIKKTNFLIMSILFASLFSAPLYALRDTTMDLNEVINKLDNSGRRMCHEIMQGTAHIGFSSGIMALDRDGAGPVPAKLSYCDAVTGKTLMLSMAEEGSVSGFYGEEVRIEKVLQLSRGLGIKMSQNESGLPVKTISVIDSLADKVVLLRLPVKTDEIEIKGIKKGDVVIMKKKAEAFLTQSVKTLQLSDSMIFKMNDADHWYIAFKPSDGEIIFDSIWIR